MCDCASLCYLCMPPTVLERSSPPPPSAHTSWLREPGRIWGHGLAWAWGWWAAGGEEGGLRGGPYISHSSQEKRGQGSPSSHPSDLCVRCLPAHPRGAARDAASCLAGPKPGGPGARGQSPPTRGGAAKNFLTSSNMLRLMEQTDSFLGPGSWWRMSGHRWGE